MENITCISEDIDINSGTSFSKGEEYVDYKSRKEGISFTTITDLLVDRGFLKFISQIDL